MNETASINNTASHHFENNTTFFSRWPLVEFCIWLGLTALALTGVMISSRYNDYTLLGKLADNYGKIVASFLILFVPVLTKLVFGRFPLDALSNYLIKRGDRLALRKNSDPTITTNNIDATLSWSPGISWHAEQAGKTAIDYLRRHSRESRLVATGILNRALTYVFAGVLIAAAGLVFFFSQENITKLPTDLITTIVVLAPRFGILFFIEFIALFFLRQYRATMEEYRYYDGVARSREEMVVAYFLLESPDGKQLVDAVNVGAFSSKTSALAPGHSTEVLEARKLEGSDLAGLAKILEGLAAFKK